MIYHTVYRTQNLVNGKYYFGVHKTSNPYDEYLGSGKVIRRAIKKHGKASFIKNVCFIFDNPEEAFVKEFELIETYRVDPLCYNLRQGGSGGFDWINQTHGQLKFAKLTSAQVHEIRRKAVEENKFSAELAKEFGVRPRTILVILRGATRKWETNGVPVVPKHRCPKWSGPREVSTETRKKISEAGKGRKHKPESIEKMRLARLANPTSTKGMKMPEGFGDRVAASKRGKPRPLHVRQAVAEANKNRPPSCWIYRNGVVLKVKLSELDSYLQQGWQRGRIRAV